DILASFAISSEIFIALLIIYNISLIFYYDAIYYIIKLIATKTPDFLISISALLKI
ncbi:unnamed protein product, partial [marine sediment metagenome]